MFLIRLWHYLKGYVIIIVSGLSAEKFINICTRRQILLWDMERLDANTIQMKMSIRGFKNARTAVRKSRCQVRIKTKKGLPFSLSKYKKRKGFVFGLIAFAVIIYLMTSIIWSIEITGNYHVEKSILMEQMNELGIYRGAAKRSIDPKYVADLLMLKNRELSWVGVEIKGTRLHISVKEGIEPPKIIPMDKPCHIVSKSDGIILSVKAKNGLAMVKEGDTVTKGQILISGTVESLYPEFGSKQVHAMGEVISRTWYEVIKEVPIIRLIRRRTGQEWNKYSVYFLDFQVSLPNSGNPFVLYETSVSDKAIIIGTRYKLPFGLIVQNFYELKEEEQMLDQEQARKLAHETALSEIKKKISKEAEIIDKQVQIVSEEGKEYVTITVECTEDIAVEQEIGGN